MIILVMPLVIVNSLPYQQTAMGNGYFSNAEYLYSYIEGGDTSKAADLVKVTTVEKVEPP